MATQTALIIDGGTQKRIVASDTLAVGVGINPSAAGPLNIGTGVATSIVIGAGGITTSFPGPVALTGGIATVGGTTFSTSATFEGDVTFGTDGGADAVDTTTFIALVSSNLVMSGTIDDSGTATSGGASTITDTGATWTVNAYAGNVVAITGGTGIGQTRVITSNTIDTITTETAWAIAPDNTSTYEVLVELFKLRNMADPTLPQDAATKAYVDASSTAPGGTDGAVQYNNGGAFGGVAAQLFFDDGTNQLHVGGNTPNEKLTVSGVISIGEGTAPTATTAFGKLWANSAADARPYFQDDTGQSFNLTLDRFNALATGGAITVDVDPILPTYNSVTLNGNAIFSSANLGNGRSASIRVVCDGTLRTLTFPAGWTWMGTAPPADIAANDVGWLSIVAFGATDADVVAAWIVENTPAVVNGSGTVNQIAFWTSSSAIGGDPQLTYDSGTDVVTLVGGLTQTVGAVSLTAGAASSFTTTVGALTITAAAASTWSTAAGDLNLTATTNSVVITGAEAAADAVTITSSNAAGGVDVNAGTGGVTIDTTGAFSIDGAAASNLSVTGANLTLSTITSGDVVIATNGDASAIVATAAGDVGIGDATPSQKFTVGSASQFAVSSGGVIKTYNGAAPTDGQVLIGNTAGASFDAATLTAGSGISITPGAGTITIASVGGSAETLDIAGTAFEPLVINDLVRYVNDAGTPRVQQADSDDTARQNPVGFVLAAAAANGDPVTIRIAGVCPVDAARFDLAPGLADVGSRVFMSTTAGQVTLTAPSTTGDVVQRIGILVDGSGSPKVLLQIGEPITL